MEPRTSAGHQQLPDARSSQRLAAPAGPVVNALRWRQVLRGEERQLRGLRRWVASVLPDCPARDDVISVATGLASNALRHTASGRGGWFAVEITRYRAVVRVLVADQGGQGEPRVIDDPDGESGRGLLLVSGLSLRTGVAGDQRGRLVWADVAFDAADGFGEVSAHDPYEAAIRDGQARLARRFGDVPAWFGRSTLAWWALAESGELVTASSAPELARLLDRRRSRLAQCPLGAGQPWQGRSVRGLPHAGREASQRPAPDLAASPGQVDAPNLVLAASCGQRGGPLLASNCNISYHSSHVGYEGSGDRTRAWVLGASDAENPRCHHADRRDCPGSRASLGRTPGIRRGGSRHCHAGAAVAVLDQPLPARCPPPDQARPLPAEAQR